MSVGLDDESDSEVTSYAGFDQPLAERLWASYRAHKCCDLTLIVGNPDTPPEEIIFRPAMVHSSEKPTDIPTQLTSLDDDDASELVTGATHAAVSTSADGSGSASVREVVSSEVGGSIDPSFHSVNAKERKSKELGGGVPTQRVFLVNRLLLCSCSEVLDAMIIKHSRTFKDVRRLSGVAAESARREGGAPGSSGLVHSNHPTAAVVSADSDIVYELSLVHDSPVGMEKVIEYAYRGELVSVDLGTVFDTLQVASKYAVKPLETICCSFLQTQITWKQAFEMLLKVHQARKQFATDACLKVFWYRRPDELEEMFGDVDFLCFIPEELLRVLIASDHTQIREERIWESLIKWAFLQHFRSVWFERMTVEPVITETSDTIPIADSSLVASDAQPAATSASDASPVLIPPQESVAVVDVPVEQPIQAISAVPPASVLVIADDGEAKMDAGVLDRFMDVGRVVLGAEQAGVVAGREDEKGGPEMLSDSGLLSGDVSGTASLHSDLVSGSDACGLVNFIRKLPPTASVSECKNALQHWLNQFEILNTHGLFLKESSPVRKMSAFVRYPLMDPAYFTKKVKPLGLLTSEDLISVYSHVHGSTVETMRFNVESRCSLSDRRLSNNVFKINPPTEAMRAAYEGSLTTFANGSLIKVEYDFRNNRVLPLIGDRRRRGWIGLVPSHIESRMESDNDEFDIDYCSLASLHGTCYLKCKANGDYEIRAFSSDDNGEQIDSGISVTVAPAVYPAEPGPRRNEFIAINRSEVHVMETFNVRYDFSAFDNNPEAIVLGSAWIGIVPATLESRLEVDNDNQNVGYNYITDVTGELRLECRRPGDFQVRCFTRDDSGHQIGQGLAITVRALDPDSDPRHHF